jgi:lipopolysaccharide transport system permease protein
MFGGLVKIPSDNLPYPLFSLSALIPWGYFSNSVMRTSRSLVDNVQVISKVYFPRMALPLAAAISGLVDLGASFVVFLVAFAFYRMPLRLEMLWLPALVLVAFAFALAMGFWLATLSVKYRDVSFAINFLLQALMYASPVIIYPVSLVPHLQIHLPVESNDGRDPGFRWSLLGVEKHPGMMFYYPLASSTGPN